MTNPQLVAKFQQFRQNLYNGFEQRSDTLMDLPEAAEVCQYSRMN